VSEDAAMPRPPGTWTEQELSEDAQFARSAFVQSRLAALDSERQTYLQAHAANAVTVEKLMGASEYLLALTGASLQDREVLHLARQLAIPPISVDDLDTLTDSCFGQWLGQKTDRGKRPTPAEFAAAADLISARLDTDRMPWLAAGREPSTEELRMFAEWAAAAPAIARVLTERRNASSARQEAATRNAAQTAGYLPVKPPGTLSDPIAQMPAGSYSIASRKLNGTSMDTPVRLSEAHPTGLLFLAVECKVSNSSLNSRKRLIEVTRKREVWDGSATLYQSRTAAVLSGVFSLARLLEAQSSGVFIFWEHRLDDLTDFLRG
jgi:hypothetical protein